METDRNVAPHQGSMKKPYEAPELVVMGAASEMTQAGAGGGIDGGFTSSTTTS